MQNQIDFSGLYIISDDILTPKNQLLEKIKLSLEGGAKIVQLRDKISSDYEIEEISDDLQKLCHQYNALFVMNDRFELAIKNQYDGLHIGKSDYSNFSSIREKFNGKIGVSCYGDIEIAKQFELNGADYVAFGSFFNSPTKPDSNIIPLNILEEAKKEINIPICAIGGINATNVDVIISKGADMVAIISDIWSNSDIKEISKIYTNKIKGNKI